MGLKLNHKKYLSFENNYIITSVCKILAVNSLGSLLNISVFLQSKAISCMNQVAW